MPKYKFPEYISHPTGRTSGRICKTCGRTIREHKQKVFGHWVCELALLDNGHWVHVSRLPIDGHKVVQRLSETFG